MKLVSNVQVPKWYLLIKHSDMWDDNQSDGRSYKKMIGERSFIKAR